MIRHREGPTASAASAPACSPRFGCWCSVAERCPPRGLPRDLPQRSYSDLGVERRLCSLCSRMHVGFGTTQTVRASAKTTPEVVDAALSGRIRSARGWRIPNAQNQDPLRTRRGLARSPGSMGLPSPLREEPSMDQPRFPCGLAALHGCSAANPAAIVIGAFGRAYILSRYACSRGASASMPASRAQSRV